MMFAVALSAQNLTVNGVVTDSHDESVIGASVFEVGTRNGTVTDIDGKFSLTVSKGATLRISYIGYTTQEVKAQTNMKVVLEEERTDLNEVVVIGYGSVRRKDVTTAVSTVSTKDLETRPIVSAVSGMQGKAAGLQITHFLSRKCFCTTCQRRLIHCTDEISVFHLGKHHSQSL
jgi:hypothetical protein